MQKRTRIAIGAVVLSAASLILWKSKAGAHAPSPTESPQAPTQQPQVEQPQPQAAGERPKVDIVFALDTTSSMTGLIDGAKATIWEIARKAQEGRPAPELRVGL